MFFTGYLLVVGLSTLFSLFQSLVLNCSLYISMSIELNEMKLQRMFKIRLLRMDTGTKSQTPLVDGVVNDALRQLVTLFNT